MKVILTESQINRILEQKNDLITTIKQMGFVPSGNAIFKHSQKPELTLTLAGDYVIVKDNGKEIAKIKTSEIEDLEGTIKSTSLKEQVDPEIQKKITNIQKKLISLGYNLGKTGADGKWGPLTDKAWKTWKSKNTKNTITTNTKTDTTNKFVVPTEKTYKFTPEPNMVQRDTFEPYAQQAISKKNLGEIMKKLGPLSKDTRTPLHVRAALDYLLGRTDTFTANELTKEEQNFLKDTILKYPNWKKSYYELWKSLGAGNLPTSVGVEGGKREKEQGKGGISNLLNPNLAGQFMYFLGGLSPQNVKISPDKKRITVKDIYDYRGDNQTNKDLVKNAGKALGSFVSGESGLYQVIRNLIALRETTGYTGYPVSITL